MANLRTNNLSGEQGQNAYRGSVFFHGGGQIDVTSNSDFAVGTGAYTAEVWFLSGLNSGENSIFGTFTSSNYGFGMWHNANNLYFEERQNSYSGDNPRITYDKFEEGYWYHLAMCRDSSSGTLRAYVNGVQIGSTTSNLRTIAGTAPTIGENGAASNQCKGYISNIRFSNTELYPSGTTFTPPTSELTADASTILLACQNSDDPTQEETGKTLTNSSLLSGQPKIIPPYGVDAGNTFGGPIQQSSQGYMYFPTGRTEERGRGRGLFNGGGGPINTIQYIQIQTEGNSLDFGDLTSTRDLMGSAASSVRGVFGGQGSPTYSNTIDFVTIATTSNAIDFGDLLNPNYTPGALASNTRAVWGGGATPADATEDTIQFATIATLGNTTDFGNLTVGRRHVGGLSSPTRGVYGAGANPGVDNVMDFITIASTGNATDFGDMTETKNDTAGCSNGTRGLFIGGNSGTLNTIEFITIATTGNGTDLPAAIRYGAGLTDTIRGVFTGGGAPGGTNRNSIDFVIIETTGNAQDFGDLITALHYPSACSDSHGGLT